MTGVNWLVRMSGMTVMNEMQQLKQGTIMQMQDAVVTVKLFFTQDSSLIVGVIK